MKTMKPSKTVKNKIVKKTKKLKFIDLFAGIGGFHLALHSVGAECVFASEWNKDARATYEANMKKISPDLFRSGNFAGDITKVDVKDIPKFDILCGGFPCQTFSNAGKRLGFEDTRGTMFFYVANILREKKPKAFFLENVRGLLSHDGGKTFKTILSTLEEIGYTVKYKLVKACEYGVPQIRPRVYIVGFLDAKKAEKFDFPEPVKLKKTMSDVFEGKCDREVGFTLRCGGVNSGIDDRRNWDCYRVDGKVKRLTSKEGKRMQGFPDSYKFPVSERQAMKQLGNSVAVPAIKAVAAEMIKALK